MIYEFAPMEGVTHYLFRQAHHCLFGGADRYYTPFLSPNANLTFTTKEENEIDPAHNAGYPVVPQLLTNRAPYFLWAMEELRQRGYREVNFNLGCPSGTVTAKGKGAGFLSDPEGLDAFLDDVFSHAGEMKISVKTRVGRRWEEEWPRLLDIYNRYPISELIVHPRVQTDFYKGEPRWDAFSYAVENSKNPLAYNGNLFTAEDVAAFARRFPTVDTVMLGRGAVTDPSLFRRCRGGEGLTRQELKTFHDRLYEGYRTLLSGEKNPIYRMRELWSYWGGLFVQPEDCLKKIRRAEGHGAYQQAVEAIFQHPFVHE